MKNVIVLIQLILMSSSVLADTNIPVNLLAGDSKTLPGPNNFTYQVTCSDSAPPPAVPTYIMAVIEGIGPYGWHKFCGVGVDQISALRLAKSDCFAGSDPNQIAFCNSQPTFSTVTDPNACQSVH